LNQKNFSLATADNTVQAIVNHSFIIHQLQGGHDVSRTYSDEGVGVD